MRSKIRPLMFALGALSACGAEERENAALTGAASSGAAGDSVAQGTAGTTSSGGAGSGGAGEHEPDGLGGSARGGAPGMACGAEADAAWGTGDDVGILDGDVWTPGRDADGRVNCLSWLTLPVGRWVQVTGTRLDALDAEVKAAVAGWSDRGSEDWNGVLADWVGMAWDTAQGSERGWVTVGGGHDGSSNDGVYRLDLRTMTWSIDRLPSDSAAWPAAYNSSYTNFTPAMEYYAANPSNVERVYNDEFFDPSNPAISSRTPTARHTYGSTVFVPELGGAGKILMGCRRYWEYDVETATWSLPLFPFDAAATYSGATGYSGESMNGWWNSTEGRYYISPTQDYNSSQTWSVLAGGSDWRWEGGYPFGGWDAYSTAQDQRGQTLHTLLYVADRPTLMRITDLDTREMTDHPITLGESFSGALLDPDPHWDGHAVTHVAETGQYLANMYLVEEGMLWAWIDEATWVAERAVIEGSYPAIVNSNTMTKLEYFPDMHALVWVNIAEEDIRIIRLL